MQDFQQKLDSYRREIDRRLRELPLPKEPADLYEPIRYSLNTQGKRIRPLLTLLSGEGFGALPENLMPAALAVELLHTFTLIHDDIIDQDTHRRGVPTIHAKWDENTAILAGDALIALAFSTLLKTPVACVGRLTREFSRAMQEICEGQMLDIEFEGREFVSREEYLDMVGKKTGCLLGLCGQLGALIAGQESSIVEAIRRFGIEMGQAFQIQDDLLEITSDVKTMGKSLFSDIAAGKKTLPLILALADKRPTERRAFRQYLQKNVTNRQAIRAAFTETDSLRRCDAEVQRRLAAARRHLDRFPPPVRDHLAAVIHLISNRQS